MCFASTLLKKPAEREWIRDLDNLVDSTEEIVQIGGVKSFIRYDLIKELVKDDQNRLEDLILQNNLSTYDVDDVSKLKENKLDFGA